LLASGLFACSGTQYLNYGKLKKVRVERAETEETDRCVPAGIFAEQKELDPRLDFTVQEGLEVVSEIAEGDQRCFEGGQQVPSRKDLRAENDRRIKQDHWSLLKKSSYGMQVHPMQEAPKNPERVHNSTFRDVMDVLWKVLCGIAIAALIILALIYFPIPTLIVLLIAVICLAIYGVGYLIYAFFEAIFSLF
jgi:hypothetical protein